jgi:hypothetical protein
MIIDRNALPRIRMAADRLGHVLGPFRATTGTLASAECTRPGCNMGLSVDLHGYPSASGAAVTYACAGQNLVAGLTSA